MIAEAMLYAAAVLVVAGALFGLLASVGLLRLPDLYTRLHASSKAGVVGVGLTLLGVALAGLDGAVALRAVLGIGFLILTTPLSAHLLARAALRAGIAPSQLTNTDELPERFPSHEEMKQNL